MAEIQSFFTDVPELPITPRVDSVECRQFVRERYTFDAPVPLEDLLADIRCLMRKWTLHVTNPRCFGNFNPSVTLP